MQNYKKLIVKDLLMSVNNLLHTAGVISPKNSVPGNEMEDIVVQAFSEGDKQAYVLIYNDYRDIVLSNIGKIVHQQDIAEDILQDVFIKLWEHKHQLKTKKSLGAWLFRVSYNASIDHVRSCLNRVIVADELNRKELADFNISPDVSRILALKEALLQEAIYRLPARKRQVFELCKIQGKSYQEASAIMNIASTTVKEYIIEANKFIKKYVLEKYSRSAMGILLCTLIDVL